LRVRACLKHWSDLLISISSYINNYPPSLRPEAGSFSCETPITIIESLRYAYAHWTSQSDVERMRSMRIWALLYVIRIRTVLYNYRSGFFSFVLLRLNSNLALHESRQIPGIELSRTCLWLCASWGVTHVESRSGTKIFTALKNSN